MYIYTITMIEDIDKKHGAIGSVRCFGYSTDFEYVDSRVRKNATDLHECLYKYAIIEKVEEGLYPCATERWLYEFDFDNGVFNPIEVPESLRHIVNFGIG